MAANSSSLSCSTSGCPETRRRIIALLSPLCLPGPVGCNTVTAEPHFSIHAFLANVMIIGHGDDANNDDDDKDGNVREYC